MIETPGGTVMSAENEPSLATGTSWPATVTLTPAWSSETVPVTVTVVESATSAPRAGLDTSRVGALSGASSEQAATVIIRSVAASALIMEGHNSNRYAVR